jgi:hypothetical protein
MHVGSLEAVQTFLAFVPNTVFDRLQTHVRTARALGSERGLDSHAAGSSLGTSRVFRSPIKDNKVDIRVVARS